MTDSPPASTRRLQRWPSLHGIRSSDASVGATPDGWSGLVCATATPEERSSIGPWTGEGLGPFIAYSVPGSLDPSLVGVLAGLVEPLAQAGVPVMALSTYRTDWLLVEERHAAEAEASWVAAGIEVLDA